MTCAASYDSILQKQQRNFWSKRAVTSAAGSGFHAKRSSMPFDAGKKVIISNDNEQANKLNNRRKQKLS